MTTGRINQVLPEGCDHRSDRANVCRCYLKSCHFVKSHRGPDLSSHRNENNNTHFWDAVRQAPKVVASLFYEANHFWIAHSCVVSIGRAYKYKFPFSADETNPVIAFHSPTYRLGRPTFVNRYPARRHQIKANCAQPNKLSCWLSSTAEIRPVYACPKLFTWVRDRRSKKSRLCAPENYRQNLVNFLSRKWKGLLGDHDTDPSEFVTCKFLSFGKRQGIRSPVLAYPSPVFVHPSPVFAYP